MVTSLNIITPHYFHWLDYYVTFFTLADITIIFISRHYNTSDYVSMPLFRCRFTSLFMKSIDTPQTLVNSIFISHVAITHWCLSSNTWEYISLSRSLIPRIIIDFPSFRFLLSRHIFTDAIISSEILFFIYQCPSDAAERETYIIVPSHLVRCRAVFHDDAIIFIRPEFIERLLFSLTLNEGRRHLHILILLFSDIFITPPPFHFHVFFDNIIYLRHLLISQSKILSPMPLYIWWCQIAHN